MCQLDGWWKTHLTLMGTGLTGFHYPIRLLFTSITGVLPLLAVRHVAPLRWQGFPLMKKLTSKLLATLRFCWELVVLVSTIIALYLTLKLMDILFDPSPVAWVFLGPFAMVMWGSIYFERIKNK